MATTSPILVGRGPSALPRWPSKQKGPLSFGGKAHSGQGGAGMFISNRCLAVVIATVVVFCGIHTARAQTQSSNDRIDLLFQHRLSRVDLGIDRDFQTQFPTGSCSQQRPEPPIKCDCTDGQGHISPRQAECYSCWNPSDGQKCGGPYCQSCTEVCSAGNAGPSRGPNGCLQSPH